MPSNMACPRSHGTRWHCQALCRPCCMCRRPLHICCAPSGGSLHAVRIAQHRGPCGFGTC
jgi:hypothetical protein